MAAPLKPWERGGAQNVSNQAYDNSIGSSIPSAIGNAIPSPQPDSASIQGAGRPPIPPRPDTTAMSPAAFGQNSLYGGAYGGYSSVGYGGMYSSPYMGGGYGLGGGYSPYNRLGGYNSLSGATSNSFVNQAESSAQGAFQSVESVVSAVSSVSMMLESTYFALHNSFRAVLGVADQFARLKLQLTQVAASFAVFRFMRWLYRRLQVLLGLRQAGLSEDAWANAVRKSAVEAQQKFPGHNKSSWPLVMFMAIILGGPYLVWKMLCNISGNDQTVNAKGWANGSTDHVVGECKYNFAGEREDEISVKEGQRINLAPAELQPRLRENDWLLASADGVNIGVVPATYVRILGTRKGQTSGNTAQVDTSSSTHNTDSDNTTPS